MGKQTGIAELRIAQWQILKTCVLHFAHYEKKGVKLRIADLEKNIVLPTSDNYVMHQVAVSSCSVSEKRTELGNSVESRVEFRTFSSSFFSVKVVFNYEFYIIKLFSKPSLFTLLIQNLLTEMPWASHSCSADITKLLLYQQPTVSWGLKLYYNYALQSYSTIHLPLILLFMEPRPSCS
jgi:hypothetical protein